MKRKRPRFRKPTAISNSRSRRGKVAAISSSRWTAYATAGAASALASVSTAEADIHYRDVDPDEPINAPFVAGSTDQTYRQLDQPGNSINPFHYRFPNPAYGVALFGVYGNAPAVAGFLADGGGAPGSLTYLSKLSFGQAISARPFIANGTPMYPGAFGQLALGAGYGFDQWLDPGIGFVGFRFDNGGGPQYGWARIDMDGAPGNSFTLLDYAWGDVGDSITAGQIPEPGSLALLALGGAGLLVWRKRRAKAAA